MFRQKYRRIFVGGISRYRTERFESIYLSEKAAFEQSQCYMYSGRFPNTGYAGLYRRRPSDYILRGLPKQQNAGYSGFIPVQNRDDSLLQRCLFATFTCLNGLLAVHKQDRRDAEQRSHQQTGDEQNHAIVASIGVAFRINPRTAKVIT